MVIVHAMTRRKFQVAAVHSRRCGTRAIESLQSKHQFQHPKSVLSDSRMGSRESSTSNSQTLCRRYLGIWSFSGCWSL